MVCEASPQLCLSTRIHCFWDGFANQGVQAPSPHKLAPTKKQSAFNPEMPLLSLKLTLT